MPGGVSSIATPPIESTPDDPLPARTPVSARRPITAMRFRLPACSGSSWSWFLQQYDAALGHALRDGKARRGVDRARRLVAIERAGRGEAAQDAARHVVDARLGNLAALDGCFQGAGKIALLVELLVEARIRRRAVLCVAPQSEMIQPLKPHSVFTMSLRSSAFSQA